MMSPDVRLLEQINSYYKKCLVISDYLTDNPEIGGTEEKAVACITRFLESEGYQITSPYKGVPCSFLAIPAARTTDTSPRAVFMCEYDALPGIGHACGHSLSCGVSLLAAVALNAAYPDLPVRIDIMGTPGEENIAGKALLMQQGAFEPYEFAAMAHMNGNGNITCFNTLALNAFDITFRGRSSHASSFPEKGLNALNAARIFMDAMDMWRQHLPRGCQIHCAVKEAGLAPGIIPDKAVLDYWFRAESVKNLRDLEEKAKHCAEGAALCTGTSASMECQGTYNAPLFCTPLAEQLISEIFEALGLDFRRGGPARGASDAGNINLQIPVIHPFIHITGGKEIPLHNKEFADILKTEEARRGVYNGALLLTMFALRLANSPETLALLKKQHAEMLAQREKGDEPPY